MDTDEASAGARSAGDPNPVTEGVMEPQDRALNTGLWLVHGVAPDGVQHWGGSYTSEVAAHAQASEWLAAGWRVLHVTPVVLEYPALRGRVTSAGG